jgi:hypothetical protein
MGYVSGVLVDCLMKDRLRGKSVGCWLVIFSLKKNARFRWRNPNLA